MADLTGTELGKYQVRDRIGGGAFASVYKAYDPDLERYVAIKVLHEHLNLEPQILARFEREAKVVANLRHSHILPLLETGREANCRYLVMPYIDTGTLKDLIQQQGVLDIARVVVLLTQIAGALDYAHSQRVLHRDIKPGNILIDASGNALLADFGLTRLVDGSGSLTGSGVVGTLNYMSPEQLQGASLNTHTDNYSMGVVLYEMLTGEVPFKADPQMSVIQKHLSAPVPSARTKRPDLAYAVDEVLQKAMAKAPADRFQSCGELAKAFEKAISEMQISPAAAAEGDTSDHNGGKIDLDAATLIASQPLDVQDEFNIHMAIQAFHGAQDREDWQSAQDWLRRIRGSGMSPAHFPVETYEGEVEEKIRQIKWEAEAEVGYRLILDRVGKDEGISVYKRLQSLWYQYPDYDPENLKRRYRIFDILPTPFDWCEIEAGQVEVRFGRAGGNKFAIPKDFYISKYPITNAQFQVFVNAPDGYSKAGWWDYSGLAQSWRTDHSEMPEIVFPGDDLPRSNVSWYDVVAFCRWLSNKLGYTVTLPTEQQWQRAAQGDDEREYPWGDDFDHSRCNIASKSTTPVTQYPNGASPFGVMDMAGNVAEWCLTKWGEFRKDSNNLDGEEERVLRGYPHYGDRYQDASVKYRVHYLPSEENNGNGFRLVTHFQ